MSSRADVEAFRSRAKIDTHSPVALSPDGNLVAYGVAPAKRLNSEVTHENARNWSTQWCTRC